MHADYGRNRDRDGEPTKAFEARLFVWTTVMSRPAGDRAIVDAGLKALAFDSGPPLVCDEPAATYEPASGEHGSLAVSAATNRLGLGDKIRPATCRTLAPLQTRSRMTVSSVIRRDLHCERHRPRLGPRQPSSLVCVGSGFD